MDSGPMDSGPADSGPTDAGPLDGGDAAALCDDAVCDSVMSVLNARGACVRETECIATACLPGFGDCDAEPGCETDLTEASNCGGCGVTCSSLRGCVSIGTRALCDESRVEQVFAFGDTSCAQFADGDLACWGNTETGQARRVSGSTGVADGGMPDGGSVDAGVPSDIRVPDVVATLDRGEQLEGGGRFVPDLFSTACALSTEGAVSCWGSNQGGQLGTTPDLDPHPDPVSVDLGGAATDLAVGFNFACAVRAGQVVCWGDSARGQLGGAAPFAPLTLSANAIAVEAGNEQACAILEDGRVECWGSNSRGQAGASGAINPSPPTLVVDSADAVLTGMEELALGNGVSCARRLGEVFCWGQEQALGNGGLSGDRHRAARVVDASETGTDPLQGVIRIVAGAEHVCALLDDGGVVCWGRMGDGASNPPLGTADATQDESDRPVTVERAMDEPLANVIAISAGRRHVCALDVSHRVFCWGGNDQRQLGRDFDGVDPVVAPAVGLGRPALVPGQAALALHTSISSACLRGASGGVACWGNQNSGRLGNGSHDSGVLVIDPAPIVMPTGEAFPQFTDIALGNNNACAIALDGSLYCWGDADFDLLPVAVARLTMPTRIDGITDLQDIAVERNTVCAVTPTGVQCWGRNDLCAAARVEGTPPTCRAFSSPTPVALPVGAGDPVEARVGMQFACVRTHLGRVLCWGDDTFGQRGDGESSSLPHEPAFVLQSDGTPLEGAVSLTVGRRHACVRLYDGSLQCWGSDSDGQLGIGVGRTSRDIAVPPVRARTSLFRSPTSGQESTCAFTDADELECWGQDTLTPTPVDPPSEEGSWENAVMRLEPRTGNACAMYPATPDAPERVYCWGDDSAVLGREAGVGTLTAPTELTFFPPVP
ncbi:MAG: RCC1 domain-containing protein [Sandaracinaceae bacterium]